MSKRFVVGVRSERALIPESLEEYLPLDHLARFVWRVVEKLDLRDLLATYSRDLGGRPALDPKGLLAVILYGHAVGVASSRGLEQACREQIAFRYLCGNVIPDHSTFSRFRGRYMDHLGCLLGQCLGLCAEAGLVNLGVVSIDGTKIQANASLASNRTYETLVKELEKAAATLDQMKAQAAPETRLGKRFQCAEERLRRLSVAKTQVEMKQAEAAAVHEDHLQKRAAKERVTGRKLRGRKPKEVPAAPKEEAKANLSDPESRIMKTRKGYAQAYNAQLAVTADQIILAVSVTNEANDQAQCLPMLEQAEQAVASLCAKGQRRMIKAAVLDAGYNRSVNLGPVLEKPYPIYIAMEKDRKQRKQKDRKAPRGRCPKGLTPAQRMKRRLDTKVGQRTYALRSQTVEPVNGQLKADGAGQMLRRGLAKVHSDFTAACIAHNLKKMWRHDRP
jgi:transposase